MIGRDSRIYLCNICSKIRLEGSNPIGHQSLFFGKRLALRHFVTPGAGWMRCSSKKKQKKKSRNRKPQSVSLAARVADVVGNDRCINALPPSVLMPLVARCLVCLDGFNSAILGARAETK